MDCKPLDLIQVEAVPLEERRESMQRVIEQMFMVDRVELAIFDQIQCVSELKNRDTGWFQKAFNTSDKIINLVHMSDHVISDHDVRKLTFTCQLFGALQSEEIVNGW